MLRAAIQARCTAYRKAIASASSDLVAKELMRDYKRFLCRNDLFYLLCVTGHEKIAGWKEIYQPFCDEVSLLCWNVVRLGIQPPSEGMIAIDDVGSSSDFVMQRLYLCYRAFYKTTVVTIGNSAQLLLNFPNIHIVLCHNKQETSSKNLVAIKNLFLNRPQIGEATRAVLTAEYGISYPTAVRDLFPEMIPEGKDWGSTDKFSLANRTDWQRPEASVEAKGVDTEITGGHWQVAKKNDLVTEKSVNTEEQIEKTADWDSRFNAGHFDDRKFPLQDYEGTRYHYNDLYSIKKEDSSIKLIEIPIIKDLDLFKNGDDSQITHPLRYKRDDIMLMKDENGAILDNSWVFMCQMMMRPVNPANQRFTPEMIHTYEDYPSNLVNVLLVDPANEKKKKSDWTAMSVVGVGSSHYYILDMVRDKLGPTERINTAIDLIKRWNCKEIGWEKVGLSTDTFYLEERRRELGMSFFITEVTADNRSKEDRIRDILIPQYLSGQWRWPKRGKLMKYSLFVGNSVDIVDSLEDEFLQFPNGKHDDMLDTQTFLTQLKVVRPVDVEFGEPEERPMTFGEYIKMRSDRVSAERSDPWSGLRLPSRV